MKSERVYLVPTYYFLGVATGALVLILSFGGLENWSDYRREYNR